MLVCCKHSWKVKDQGSPGYSHGTEYKIRADTVNTLYFLTDISDDQNMQELRGSGDFKGSCININICKAIPRKKGGGALDNKDNKCTDPRKEPDFQWVSLVFWIE